MPGVRPLRKIQLGKETTPGTAVAATAVWRGLGTIDDQQEHVQPDETVGLMVDSDRTYVPMLKAALSMESVEASFEQLGYILAAGVKNVTTGSADGAGSGKIYDYSIPSASKNTITTYTIEGGDDQQEEEAEYCFVESFKLSGKPMKALMVSAEWIGRQVSASSFTGSLTPATIEEMLFGKCKLYIDAVGGTIGGTVKSNTLMGFDLSVTTGWQPVFSADGELYFSFIKLAKKPVIELEVTFEHDGTATAEKTNWRNRTSRQIRIQCLGSTLTSAGTTYSVKTFNIDLAGRWLKFDKIDEIDGNDVVKGKFRAMYNSTAALFARFLVVNELAALT